MRQSYNFFVVIISIIDILSTSFTKLRIGYALQLQ